MNLIPSFPYYALFLQSFFIGGGMYPTSVVAGFDMGTLSTAFNVSPLSYKL